jgi:hypothetical protein
MPDWLTYVLSAWVLCEIVFLLGFRDARRYLGAAALGVVLPDIVKGFFLLKTLTGLDLIAFSVPFATPVGALLVVGLVSLFFERDEIRRVVSYMTAGAIVHLVWDLTLHPYGGGTLVYFPLSFQQYSLGLIWSDSILPLLLIGLPAVLLAVRRVLVEGNPLSDPRTRRGL